MGGDYFALCLALEELGKVDQSVAITLEAGCRWARCRSTASATRTQKQEWLPLLASGKALGAFGLTEPGGGTRRRRDQDHRPARRRATGSSTAPSSSSPTRAPTSPGSSPSPRSPGEADGRKEISSILVPCRRRVHRRAGVQQGRLERLRHPSADASTTCGCPRRTCSASAAAATRTSCASSTRAASRSPRCRSAPRRAASTSASSTPRSARRSAQPIGTNQAIAFKIARMEARAHTARTAYYDAAALMLAGKPFKKAGRHRQARRQRGRDGQRPRRHPDLRRLRLHERVPRRAPLPRQQDPRDRRGHNRSAADADRAGGRVCERTKKRVDKKVVVQRGLWFEEFETGVALPAPARAAPSPRPTTSCSPR